MITRTVTAINIALHGAAIQLQDVQALAKHHDTFWAPSAKQLKHIHKTGKNGSG